MSRVILSIDAMGGDRAPESVIGGLAKAARKDDTLHFLIHGGGDALERALRRRRVLNGRYELRPADEVVAMTDKPSVVVRRGRKTSMWRALESVRDGEAAAAVSAGNTGALMAMALFCLRSAQGVDRPAIAALWPSRGEARHCIALDMGADIRATAQDLACYAVMGSEYARIALKRARPRVGLLNVGTEETKGRPETKEAAEKLRAMAESDASAFEFVGYIEASAITSGAADVVVTDGFTGNVALKSAEGVAKFIGDHLREAFSGGLLSKIAVALAYPSLRRLKHRIDPRRVNGGVFLGLNGLVVKSHGGADATGFAAAVDLAASMARENFTDRLAEEVEKALKATQSERMAANSQGKPRSGTKT